MHSWLKVPGEKRNFTKDKEFLFLQVIPSSPMKIESPHPDTNWTFVHAENYIFNAAQKLAEDNSVSDTDISVLRICPTSVLF